MSEEHDPRWQWIKAGTYAEPDLVIKGPCNHITPIPVHAAGTDELVARLCPDCDAQLPVE